MRNTSRGAAWVAAGVLLTACAPPTPKITLQQDELRGRLKKNDLRFVILPDASTTLVEVDVRYEVGAREDPPGKAGLAHLVEHLMFEQRPDGPGTPTLSAAIRLLTLASNAYTNWDSTHYMLNARADQLDALIKIEAMRMHYGCATISQEEFLREREVVRNEIRGHNRDAEGRIEALTLAGVYPAGHAYAREVGTPVQIEWTMLEGVNDGDQDVDELCTLLQGVRGYVNFIVYNPVDGLPFKAPSRERIIAMVRAVKSRGILATIRDSSGPDAEAACGQLRLRDRVATS